MTSAVINERDENRRAQAKTWSAKYRAAHRGKVLAALKAYRATHLEQERARNNAYKAAHRKAPVRKLRSLEEKRMYCRAYHVAHKEEIRARKQAHRIVCVDRLRARYTEWARSNPGMRATTSAKRRAAALRATPQWTDTRAIRAIYLEAAKITNATGIRHDVDHVYPLQSANVCGLHVVANLQILTHDENVSKNNRLPVVSVGGSR